MRASAKALLESILRQDDGSAILIASANTAMATPQAIAYCAGNVAIVRLTRREMAPIFYAAWCTRDP